MNIEEFITKLFGGWEPARVNFITNVLKKEGIQTVEQMKSLESNFWESLRGLPNFDANKTWSFDGIVEAAVEKALDGSHVSRINFFIELLKENLEMADLMHFECEYLEALRKLTMTEIYEIRRLVRKRIRVEKELCDADYQLIDFEYEEALRNVTDEEIEKLPKTNYEPLDFEYEEALSDTTDEDIEKMPKNCFIYSYFFKWIIN